MHDLPDYVFFNHSIHVNKGVGCNTCHGPVHEMAIVYQYASLQMEWCLECHRQPERFVRDRKEVFNMGWRAENKSKEEIAYGLQKVKEYNVRHKAILQSCSTCHR